MSTLRSMYGRCNVVRLRTHWVSPLQNELLSCAERMFCSQLSRHSQSLPQRVNTHSAFVHKSRGFNEQCGTTPAPITRQMEASRCMLKKEAVFPGSGRMCVMSDVEETFGNCSESARQGGKYLASMRVDNEQKQGGYEKIRLFQDRKRLVVAL